MECIARMASKRTINSEDELLASKKLKPDSALQIANTNIVSISFVPVNVPIQAGTEHSYPHINLPAICLREYKTVRGLLKWDSKVVIVDSDLIDTAVLVQAADKYMAQAQGKSDPRVHRMCVEMDFLPTPGLSMATCMDMIRAVLVGTLQVAQLPLALMVVFVRLVEFLSAGEEMDLPYLTMLISAPLGQLTATYQDAISAWLWYVYQAREACSTTDVATIRKQMRTIAASPIWSHCKLHFMQQLAIYMSDRESLLKGLEFLQLDVPDRTSFSAQNLTHLIIQPRVNRDTETIARVSHLDYSNSFIVGDTSKTAGRRSALNPRVTVKAGTAARMFFKAPFELLMPITMPAWMCASDEHHASALKHFLLMPTDQLCSGPARLNPPNAHYLKIFPVFGGWNPLKPYRNLPITYEVTRDQPGLSYARVNFHTAARLDNAPCKSASEYWQWCESVTSRNFLDFLTLRHENVEWWPSNVFIAGGFVGRGLYRPPMENRFFDCDFYVLARHQDEMFDGVRILLRRLAAFFDAHLTCMVVKITSGAMITVYLYDQSVSIQIHLVGMEEPCIYNLVLFDFTETHSQCFITLAEIPEQLGTVLPVYVSDGCLKSMVSRVTDLTALYMAQAETPRIAGRVYKALAKGFAVIYPNPKHDRDFEHQLISRMRNECARSCWYPTENTDMFQVQVVAASLASPPDAALDASLVARASELPDMFSCLLDQLRKLPQHRTDLIGKYGAYDFLDKPHSKGDTPLFVVDSKSNSDDDGSA